MIVWITQGGVADRTQEALGLSDKGVILYRHQLKEQLEKVQAGQDPINVFRDPANNVNIKLRLEDSKLNSGRFSLGPAPPGWRDEIQPDFESRRKREPESKMEKVPNVQAFQPSP